MIRALLIVSMLLAAATVPAATAAVGWRPGAGQDPGPLKAGDRAPDFEIPATVPVPADRIREDYPEVFRILEEIAGRSVHE